MTIWQCAAGDGSRDYAEVFLRFGVFLAGPGDRGCYENAPHYYDRFPFIRRLVHDVKRGDLLVLKRPKGQRWQVLAVGEVTGEYEWIPNFENVEGWSLEHARRVRWVVPDQPPVITGLTRGTLKRIGKQAPRDLAQELLVSGTERQAVPLPPMPPRLETEDFIASLLHSGLSIRAAEDLSAAVLRIQRLARWYMAPPYDVSEHESRTFLVIPLLLALGWPEQRIKVEWKRIDVALFSGPYGPKAQLQTVIETKRLFSGLAWARNQAAQYAAKHPTCSRLVVTDGFTYKLFKKQRDRFVHTATASLTQLRSGHGFSTSLGGADEVFRALLPVAVD